MTNAEQAQGQLPELAALRQCLTELALPPAVRQTLDGTLTESEKRLQQRMEQMTWQIQRSALLGDIAGKIVHEIRNPLNAIFLHADVVLGELQCPTLDSRTQMMESLTDIRMEVRRLYDIMQDYLALARLPAVQYEPEDLGDFLRECGRVMQEQARTRGVILHLQGLARLGAVSLHKGTLQRAFVNLLQRALDAMPRGGTVTLRGRRTASIVSSTYRMLAAPSPKSSWTSCLSLCIARAQNSRAWGCMPCAKSSWPTVGPSTSRARQARVLRLR